MIWVWIWVGLGLDFLQSFNFFFQVKRGEPCSVAKAFQKVTKFIGVSSARMGGGYWNYITILMVLPWLVD